MFNEDSKEMFAREYLAYMDNFNEEDLSNYYYSFVEGEFIELK